MNKAELIDSMSTMTKLSKADCKKLLEAFVETVSKSLKKGKSVVLTNFGTFVVSNRKRRVGVNPSTGKRMEIPAKKVPKFKPGKKLRHMVHS
jgi:DNA-binding protein HU-beta